MEAKPASERPLHLIVVDDEPVILQILKAVFEDEPYRLSLASSGNEALEIMKRHGVDLLLTDKNLPDLNGIELLRAAKKLNPDVEVIIVTGYASLESALAAMELGAFDYVLKPLNNVFDIRRKVRRAVEKQRMAIANRALLERLKVQNAELERSLGETRKLQAELIQSEKLAGIGTLAAGIAHEISNPLFGILGLAEAILEEDDLGLVGDYARDIVEYSQTIRAVLLELSSYCRASGTEQYELVDVPRAIRDAIRLVERSADTEAIRIATDLGGPCEIRAQTPEIQQVFVNLVKNAVEALSEQRRPDSLALVTVRTGLDEGAVWAEVEDTGPGIPEENLALVFDPFFTTKQPGKGTGLGLNIVYRIVTRYGGKVSVQSTVGKGTVFRVRFPLGR